MQWSSSRFIIEPVERLIEVTMLILDFRMQNTDKSSREPDSSLLIWFDSLFSSTKMQFLPHIFTILKSISRLNSTGSHSEPFCPLFRLLKNSLGKRKIAIDMNIRQTMMHTNTNHHHHQFARGDDKGFLACSFINKFSSEMKCLLKSLKPTKLWPTKNWLNWRW